MTIFSPAPIRPTRRQVRPLICRGVYGAPGGDGLDSLARLLLSLAADEADQPARQPDPCLLWVPGKLLRFTLEGDDMSDPDRLMAEIERLVAIQSEPSPPAADSGGVED